MILLLLQVTPSLSSYDAIALAMIKRQIHQRPADTLLQSRAVTCNKSSFQSIWQNRWYLRVGRDPEPQLPLKRS